MNIFDLVLSASDLWLLSIAGTLILFLAGFMITDSRNKMNAIRPAAHAYKSEFAPEIAAVSNNSYAIDTFFSAFQRHEAAVNTIRPLLPVRHQRKLQKAWDEYCGKGTDIDCDVFITGSSTHPDLFPEFKKRFHALHGCLDDLL